MSIDLWGLIPLITRYRDTIGSGLADGDGNFQRIVQCLTDEVGVTEEEIADLANLIDADLADPEALLFLSATLGRSVGSDLGEPFQRWFIKNLIAWHKIKGTHPSWEKEFGWATGVWYRAWELWKTIPHEVGDYSRFLDYDHQLRAARFDLFTGEGDFVSFAEARRLAEHIEKIRPVHVLPRTPVILEEGTAGIATEELFDSRVTSEIPEDEGDGLRAELGIEVTCVGACETGCQTECVVGCEGGICETWWQGGPVIDADQCEVNCNISCEAGACQAGCQAGSCQSGCEACSETELFPVHVVELKPNALAGKTVLIRAYFPYPNSPFPQVLPSEWWITPSVAPRGLIFQSPYIPGGGAPPVPGLTVCQWLWCRCIKGEEIGVSHVIRGNGQQTFWSLDLPRFPHPCSVRVEAARPRLVGTAASIVQGVTQIPHPTGAGGEVLEADDWIIIRDASGAETNVVTYVTGGQVGLLCPTRRSYSGATVRRGKYNQSAHVREMQVPVDDARWYGLFEGDVDASVGESDRRANFRGDKKASVTFKDPPPRNAVITFYFYTEEDCQYVLIERPYVRGFWGRLRTETGGGAYTCGMLQEDGATPTDPAVTIDAEEVNGIEGIPVGVANGTVVLIELNEGVYRFACPLFPPVDTGTRQVLVFDPDDGEIKWVEL